MAPTLGDTLARKGIIIICIIIPIVVVIILVLFLKESRIFICMLGLACFDL